MGKGKYRLWNWDIFKHISRNTQTGIYLLAAKLFIKKKSEEENKI